MGRKDTSSSAAEAKLLEFTALMSHDYSQQQQQQRPGGPRAKAGGLLQQQHSRSATVKPLHRAATAAAAAATATDKPRRIDTARAVLPILNLAKVRHNLADEAAELATAINYDGDQEPDESKQAKSKLNVLSSYLPTSAQTQRVGTHLKPAIKSVTLRGMTAPESGQQLEAAKRESRKLLDVPKLVDGPERSSRGNWQRGLASATRGFSTVERMPLEEKLKLKLKTPRPLPEDITAESEACHRPKKGSNMVRPVKAQRAVGAKVGGLKENTIRRRPVSQRGTDEGGFAEPCKALESHAIIEQQPIGLSALAQQSIKVLKPPTLNNIGSCQPAITLGLGGNLIGSVQPSRISHTVERHAAVEACPSLAIPERASSLKSLLTSVAQVRDHKNAAAAVAAAMSPVEASLGIGATPEMVLRSCGQHLNEFEQREIVPYPQIYFLGLESSKIQPSATPNTCNFGYDDERGDYNVVDHDQLAYRYEVLGILGKGSFGQVLKCSDHKHKVLRAVKMIRNKRRFHQQALVEVKILEHLRDKAREEPTSANIVTIYESFYFRGHLCITFALHDISLYELIKRNNFQGISLVVIKSFASQLLQTLSFLRKLHVIHCDLKPENILLQHPAMSKIKVIDFGSSCFNHEKVYTYIQSRFYRSPEVILGLPYDTMIDIWSFGCILAELFSGYPLFPGENEVEQLACIMEVLGIPSNTVLEHASRKKMFFDSNNNPRIVANSWGKKHWPGSKSMAAAIGCNDALFVNFLEGCLRWDKNARLVPEELMQHPWMMGVNCCPPLPH